MTKKRLWPCVMIVALAFGPIAASQQTDAAREAEVRALISEMAKAKDRARWLEENRQRITMEIADLAEKLGDRAIRSRQVKIAQNIYYFSAIAYLWLEARPNALKSMLKQTDAQFLAAEKPEEYREVRSAALSLRKMAEDIQASDTAFCLAVLAADCSYFAGVPKDDERADGVWVESVLTDLAPALEAMTKSMPVIWSERLISLTSMTVSFSSRRFFANQRSIDPLLNKVAAAVDASVPADFAYRTNVGNEQKTIVAATELAILSYHHGNPKVASARLAGVAEQALKKGELESYLSIIYTRYRGEQATGQSPAQLHQLRLDARNVAQRIREDYRSRAGRIWNAHRFDISYGEMLRDELCSQNIESPADRFAAIESLKARTMLDYLLAPPVELKAPDLRSQSSVLETQILGSAKNEKEDDNLIGSEMKLISQLTLFSEFSKDQAERSSALSELEQIYKTSNAGFTSVATPAPLEEIQKALNADEAILEYVIPYHPLSPTSKLGILLITKRNVVEVCLDIQSGGRMSVDGKPLIDFSPLGDDVIELRAAIQSTNENKARKELGRFYEILIQPLIVRGFNPEKYKRLIVVAHGMLQYIPFAALMDHQGVPLIQKTAISMAPSASVWLELQKRGGGVDRWVAFANPKLGVEGFPPLDSSTREVEQISAILSKFRREVKLSEQASKEQLQALAPGAGILHLATHGEFPDDNTLDHHRLLLAEGSNGDGSLRAMDVRSLNLASTRLVVLSVCNGGLFRIGPTDEPYGLAPAFHLAGAQNVMGTLWELDDKFGRRFTVEFYRHLLSDGPAEAYRKACQRFISEDAPIQHWAGFVMMGPGRPFSMMAKQIPKNVRPPLRRSSKSPVKKGLR